MKTLRKIRTILQNSLAWLIFLGVAGLCTLFIIFGTKNDEGYITIDGDVKIEQYTENFIDEANKALNRLYYTDKPTDESVMTENQVDAVGLGFHTSISDILARRLPDGDNDNGKGWQCSKYTAYLATGKREYSNVHPDYGPANGKDMAAYLVKYYGFKYIDRPVEGAIGSGGFNTTYGHTVMFLYWTGGTTAMVNDANWVPLTVSTHTMDVSGWVWVVPGDYEPEPEPTPTPTPTPTPVSDCKTWSVRRGDTMGKIMKYCTGSISWGQAMYNYANKWISDRTGRSVYYGWTHGTGYGLIAGDTIRFSD